MSETVHASAVLSGGDGILIRGASGSGKTQLAALLIARGARLVADDRVLLSACHGRLIATAPSSIAGQMELRGRGIVTVLAEDSVVVRLVIEIVGPAGLERLPERHDLLTTVLGVELPRQPVADASESALVLVAAALRALSAAPLGLANAAAFGMMAPLPPDTAFS